MEYNELIARTRRADADAPAAEALMGGVRSAMQRRRRQRSLLAGMAVVVAASLAVAPAAAMPHPAPTLPAELVSQRQPAPADAMPAPLAGYLHSVRNRQIINAV